MEESNEEELADILEVIETICNYKNINKQELDGKKIAKANKRSGFNKRIILDEINYGPKF